MCTCRMEKKEKFTSGKLYNLCKFYTTTFFRLAQSPFRYTRRFSESKQRDCAKQKCQRKLLHPRFAHKGQRNNGREQWNSAQKIAISIWMWPANNRKPHALSVHMLMHSNFFHVSNSWSVSVIDWPTVDSWNSKMCICEYFAISDRHAMRKWCGTRCTKVQ